jgi:hypothetical protein
MGLFDKLISDVFAIDISIVHEWIILGTGLIRCGPIVIVGDELLHVESIRCIALDFGTKRIVKVDLTDVMDTSFRFVSGRKLKSVFISGPASITSHNMYMSCAAFIVSWEDHLENYTAIAIRWKGSSLPMCAQVSLTCRFKDMTVLAINIGLGIYMSKKAVL